ncbi:MAG: cytidine deaminase [Bacteroidales bacterium]|jgi:cytidine deaminase|nr:cytidine deaminase [Bacteroidales bacterium]
MRKRKLVIDYLDFASADEMEPLDQELVAAAIDAIKGSYSPYSHFRVGAALRLEDGTIVKGSNQENNAYPAGLCAERTAMFWAGANYPDKAFDSIAIVGSDENGICDNPATPCGECRQVMAEYQTKGGRPLKVILVGAKKIQKFSCVDDILPFIFDSLKSGEVF